MRTDHADVDRGIDIYRMAIMPRLEAMDGFCSASLMVNRALSRACATVSYDSTESLVAGRDEAWAIRAARVREAGVDGVGRESGGRERDSRCRGRGVPDA